MTRFSHMSDPVFAISQDLIPPPKDKKNARGRRDDGELATSRVELPKRNAGDIWGKWGCDIWAEWGE